MCVWMRKCRMLPEMQIPGPALGGRCGEGAKESPLLVNSDVGDPQTVLGEALSSTTATRICNTEHSSPEPLPDSTPLGG